MAKPKSLLDQFAFCCSLGRLRNAQRVTAMLQITVCSGKNSLMAVTVQDLGIFFFFLSKRLQDGKEEPAPVARYLAIIW